MLSITKLPLIFCLLCIAPAFVLSQTEDGATQGQLWLTRAETITSDILKETSNIGDLEKALLLAELGHEWKGTDAQKADAFSERSVDALFFYSREKEPDRFLETARKILVLLTSNTKQTERLIRIMSDEKDVSDKNKDLNADALVEYALETAERDPANAYRIGEIALKIGTPKELYKLILILNKQNPELAVRLFNSAVSKARTDPTYYRLQTVQLAAFGDVIFGDAPEYFKLKRPEKVAALRLLAEAITHLRTQFLSKQIAKCSSEAMIVQQVQNQYPEYLPEQIGPVQQALAACLENSSPRSQGLSDKLKNATVEELLKLADEHKDDPILRTAYLYRAALLSHEEKRFELTITILEGMSKDEKNADPDFWDELRASAASNLAFEKYEANEIQSSRKVLTDVPDPIKPFAQFGFVKLFPADDVASLPLRSDVLKEARKNFIRSNKPFAQKAAYWFRLVGLLSDVGLQSEAADTFRDIVKSFNTETDDKTKKFEIKREMAENSFPPELIESADASLAETVRLLKDPASRITIRFALLRASLHQFEILKKRAP